MSEPKGSERRRFPRVAGAVKIRLKLLRGGVHEAMEGRSRDMSVGGVAVWVARELPPGARLEVAFVGLAGGDDIVATGRAAWCCWREERQAWEAGIELLGLSEDALSKLLSLINAVEWTRRRGAHDTAGAPRTRFDPPPGSKAAYRRAGSLHDAPWHEAPLRGLSLRDVYLSLSEPLGRGADLEIQLQPDDGDPLPMTLRGMVAEIFTSVRGDTWEARVSIRHLSDQDRMRLAAWLSGMIGQ